MFCAQQVAEFRPHAEKLRQAGVGVFVVGSGAPNFARGFAARMGGEIPIFSDESRATYEALEMHRSMGSLFHPGAILKGATAIFKYRQRKTMGDNAQQGGVIVVKPDGTMPFKFLSRHPGDHARPKDVVKAALE